MVGADADLVHPDEGPDQDHRRARGADEIGHHRADREKDHVVERRRLALDLEMDASRNDKQRTDEADEGEILPGRMQHGGRAIRQTQHKIPGHGQSEGDRCVRIIVFPEMLDRRRRQRHRRDQDQQQRKRHREPQRHIASGDPGSRKPEGEMHDRLACAFRFATQLQLKMEGKPPGWFVKCGRPPDNHPAALVGDSAFCERAVETWVCIGRITG